MTANPFAALLRDVPRYDGYGTFDPDGDVVRLSEVLAALAAAAPDDLAEAGKVLECVTPGPWRADGEPWNQIVWSGADNRVCFMAHSNGLDDARDVATARFIAWCREGVPALLARIAAQEARMKELEAEITATDDLMAADSCRIAALETALAAERAKVARLVEAARDAEYDLLQWLECGEHLTKAGFNMDGTPEVVRNLTAALREFQGKSNAEV